jgi:hypothetical protein
MCKGVDKARQSCGSKLRMADRGRDLFKRRFYMVVGMALLYGCRNYVLGA